MRYRGSKQREVSLNRDNRRDHTHDDAADDGGAARITLVNVLDRITKNGG
jgi:hypothetical protein